VYAELLAQHPVYRGDVLTERLGLSLATPSMWPGQPVTVLGYREVQDVLQDAEHFSNTVHDLTVAKTMGPNLLTIDDPEHRIHRMIIQGAFSRRTMDRWRAEFIDDYVVSEVGKLVPAGRAELMRDFVLSYPVSVVHYILGLPEERLSELLSLSVALLLYRSNPEIAAAASQRLGSWLTDLVRQRRAKPGNDVTSVMATSAFPGGEALTDDEIVAFLRILMPAGAETTTRLLGSLFAYLLTEPGLLEAVRADRSLVPKAIEETLRLQSPTQYAYRLCLKPREVAGVPVERNAGIGVCLAAANRDPAIFPDPDQFRLDRGRPHLAFGSGVHVCLGMHIARVETEVAINAFLDQMPTLRLDPDQPLPLVRGVTFRSPAAVYARWD
jgi:cytochrome P450